MSFTLNPLTGALDAVSAPALAAAGGATVSMAAMPQRAPSRYDDTTRGFAVGNYWLNSASVFVLNDATSQKASWYPLVKDNAYPCDAVSGAVAVYGLIKLVSAYAGNCLRVVRASDSTTLAVGFVKTLLNGRIVEIVDTQAVDTFLVGTTGTVDILYDQSGSSNDATQTTAAKRPIIGHKEWNGIRYISFVGDVNSSTVHQLDIPTTVSIPRNLTSQYAVLNPFTSVINNAFWEIGSQASSSVNLVYQDVPTTNCVLRVNNVTPRAMFPTMTSPSVMTLVQNGTGVTFTQNNKSATGGGPTAVTSLGGMIGNTSKVSNYQGRFDFGALILFAAFHTAAQQQAIASRLYAMFGIAPQKDSVLSREGDSITYGRTLVEGKGREQYISTYLGESFISYNWGVGGQAMTSIRDNFQYRSAVVVDSTKLNVCIFFGGTNDLKLNSQTGAATWAATVTAMQSARTAGYKVLVATMLPRNDFSGQNETDRQAYNALVYANWQTYADGLVDFAGDAVMGAAGAAATAALYSDGVHPTDFGHSILAPIEAKAINSLVKAYRAPLQVA